MKGIMATQHYAFQGKRRIACFLPKDLWSAQYSIKFLSAWLSFMGVGGHSLTY